MTGMLELPPAAAIIVAVLLVIGATLTFLGNLGLVRFRSFYDRLHAPALGVSWGTGAIVLASVVFFSVTERQPALRELAIAAMVAITSPIGFLLLSQAARRRDRSKARDDSPPDH